jgi:signal transduction histidine kinase
VVLHPYFLMASLLVVVGWQAALWMAPARAVVLVIGQSLVGGLLLSAAITPSLLWPSLLSTVGFQVYGLAAAAMARGEANARMGLAAALDDLRVAQTGLAERARADERLRIARDLHDELGHGLTALGLELRAAERKGPAALGDARDLCGDLLDRLKSVVADMRGPTASLIDLGAALRDLVATTAGVDGPETVLEGDPGPTLVDLARAQVILRAAQEAITNCRRHATDASVLVLKVERADDGGIRLSARDNGRGAAPARAAGAGLTGMRERAEALGGYLRFGCGEGEGFHLTLDLPALI